jgi:hypothetical protein
MKLRYTTKELKMRGNKFLFTGILVLFGIILLFTIFVSADTTTFTVNTPASNANISGTYTFNASVAAWNTTNVSVRWWNGTSGAWVVLCANNTNSTNIALAITCSASTTALTANASSAIFNITSLESLDGRPANSTNKTGVVVANTAPYISLIGYVNGTIKNSSDTLTLNTSIIFVNISTYSACIFNINGTNLTSLLTVKNDTHGTCNTTLAQLTNANDGNQTIKIYVIIPQGFGENLLLIQYLQIQKDLQLN